MLLLPGRTAENEKVVSAIAIDHEEENNDDVVIEENVNATESVADNEVAE